MTRSNLRSWFAIAVVSSAASVFGCSGPPLSSTITGDPVCTDYSIGTGGAKLRGGLRFPVRVTILDDDDPVTKVLIYGKHSESDPSPKVVLPDKDAEYKVDWAQCPNERATAPVNAPRAKSLRSEGMTAYDCGEALSYKTATLVTKKGDPASHALKYEPPPKPDCWMDAKPEEVADAGAPDAAAVAADVADAGAADAEPMDASDAEAPDADVTDAASASDAAPAKETGDKPAEKPADKPAEKPADKPAEKPADKPAEKPANKPAETKDDKPAK